VAYGNVATGTAALLPRRRCLLGSTPTPPPCRGAPDRAAKLLMASKVKKGLGAAKSAVGSLVPGKAQQLPERVLM
jgi:hypothetical protein